MATVDIPQADDLDAVRRVVSWVADGERTPPDGESGSRRGACDRAELVEVSRQSPRHIQYRVRAAVLLGFLSEGGPKAVVSPDAASSRATRLAVTASGVRWLALEPRSDEEKLLLRASIRNVASLAGIVFDLFGERRPDKVELAQRIEIATCMARTTAVRRAQTLLAWRRRAFARQLDLFEVPVPIPGLYVEGGRV